MACVTLKRTRDFDLFNYVDTKRRRLQANSSLPSSSSSFKQVAQKSPFQGRGQEKDVLLKKIKEEMIKLKNRGLIPNLIGSFRSQTASNSGQSNSTQSMMKSLECLALRSPERDSSSDSENEKLREEPSFQRMDSPAVDSRPLFSIHQVQRICEKLLKEREEEIKTEYDRILSAKLLEQYETFLEFTKEHFQNKLQKGQLSYIS